MKGRWLILAVTGMEVHIRRETKNLFRILGFRVGYSSLKARLEFADEMGWCLTFVNKVYTGDLVREVID